MEVLEYVGMWVWMYMCRPCGSFQLRVFKELCTSMSTLSVEIVYARSFEALTAESLLKWWKDTWRWRTVEGGERVSRAADDLPPACTSKIPVRLSRISETDAWKPASTLPAAGWQLLPASSNPPLTSYLNRGEPNRELPHEIYAVKWADTSL